MLRPPLEIVDFYDPDANDKIVFVDCQPTSGNHLLKNIAIEAAAVFDHHPSAKEKYNSLFTDVRSRLASCSTIIADYLREQSIRLDTNLATALFIGASTDIGKRPILTSVDQRAARFIAQDVDFNLVIAIQNAPYPRTLYKRLYDALHVTRMIGDTAVCFGAVVDSPASMAVLADFIARCEDLKHVLITAAVGNNFFVTVRSKIPGHHAGKLAELLTAGLGSGGGHAERGAGSIPITNGYSHEEIESELLNRWKNHLNLIGRPEIPFLTN